MQREDGIKDFASIMTWVTANVAALTGILENTNQPCYQVPQTVSTLRKKISIPIKYSRDGPQQPSEEKDPME